MKFLMTHMLLFYSRSMSRAYYNAATTRFQRRQTQRTTTSSRRQVPTATDPSNHHLDGSSKEYTVPTVTLRRSRQSKAFRNGNPLVFTRAIRPTGPEPRVAQLVRVQVEADKGSQESVLGWGVYNPFSLYRVRFLCHRYLQPDLHHRVEETIAGQREEDDSHQELAVEAIVDHHLRVALQTRRYGLQLPSDHVTNTYRLVNGEGDGLSGLAVDVIGGHVVVIMSSALWCERYRRVIERVAQQQLPDHDVVWRTTKSRLDQDGWQQLALSTTDLAGWGKEGAGGREQEVSQRVLSLENGVKFWTEPFRLDSQKTGVYCDQRENRFLVSSLARNKRVLDLCCYHGGFSLTALVQGGALSAVGVDSSPDAIASCQQNAELNGVGSDKVQFVRSDVTSFLQEQFAHTENRFDLVVLDPPKLAPNAQSLDKARRKYHGLNRDAIKMVCSSGGLLLTCTCSAAMTQKDGGQYFLHMVQGAAQAGQRQVTLLSVSGAAKCHTQSPIAWPAGAYLTAALFYVHPTMT